MELSDQSETSSASNGTLTTPLVNPTNDKSHARQQQARQKWKTVLEAILLGFLILLLWGVFAAVPTVFYILKPVLQVYMAVA